MENLLGFSQIICRHHQHRVIVIWWLSIIIVFTCMTLLSVVGVLSRVVIINVFTTPFTRKLLDQPQTTFRMQCCPEFNFQVNLIQNLGPQFSKVTIFQTHITNSTVGKLNKEKKYRKLISSTNMNIKIYRNKQSLCKGINILK